MGRLGVGREKRKLKKKKKTKENDFLMFVFTMKNTKKVKYY